MYVNSVVSDCGEGTSDGDALAGSVAPNWRTGTSIFVMDATCARLMRIDPLKLRYLQEAGRFLGNADDGRIEQIGESIAARAQDYAIHKHLQHLKERGS